MKTFLFATGALLLASAGPALAQDVATPVSGSTFTGPRAEIFGGWDRLGTDQRYAFADGSRSRDKAHQNGIVGGAQIGYDFPIGDTLVAGAFGSYDLTTARRCLPQGGGCLKFEREIEGGGRIGAKLMGDKALAYVKGAYVNGRVHDTASRYTDNHDGWRAGGGLEYALNQHVYTKVEYDYTKYDTYRYTVGTSDRSFRFDRNQVLAGFGVRF